MVVFNLLYLLRTTKIKKKEKGNHKKKNKNADIFFLTPLFEHSNVEISS